MFCVDSSLATCHSFPSPSSPLCSIIGTPSLDKWPSQSAVSSEQFLSHKPIPWPNIFPEHRKDTHSLLAVSLWVGLNVDHGCRA